VIRYDNRDTGQSTCFDFAKDPYSCADMARDAVGVLDAYGVERAHVAGASMGGMIGQILALEHPERLLTLTVMMSTPGGAGIASAVQGGDADARLSPPSAAVRCSRTPPDATGSANGGGGCAGSARRVRCRVVVQRRAMGSRSFASRERMTRNAQRIDPR
jgi:pimeloyl-ACP methyl ester carboxylesterase